jgi:hypothetical protein
MAAFTGYKPNLIPTAIRTSAATTTVPWVTAAYAGCLVSVAPRTGQLWPRY